MPVTVTPGANEKSTYVVDVSFFDEDNNPVVPNNVAWTLTDLSGNVINSRTQVSISPATTVSIVLSGLDLALSPTEITTGSRLVTVEADYDSSLGSALPLNEEAEFTVTNLTVIE